VVAAKEPRLKAKFLEVPAQYRNLAEQIDDPVGWRTKLLEGKTKQK
jgi:hypothetical protein